ncbi:hypothetical protein VCHA43P273_30110 [Vibrio chagasii]|nr:hypothetical protein VCHA43P273_30110 [Vibrio chagasii]
MLGSTVFLMIKITIMSGWSVSRGVGKLNLARDYGAMLYPKT